MNIRQVKEGSMQLKDIMSQDVEVIRPDATVQEAARTMTARHIGSVIVGEGNIFEGVLTDRDITIRVAAEGRDPTRTTVREVMTREIFWGSVANVLLGEFWGS
jgi:CBS domain-containing protein